MLRAREPLPEWFMRKDISEFIRNRLKKGEEVFIS
jgi:ATP sulfurylase